MPKLKKRITVYFCLINLRDHRVEMVVMIQFLYDTIVYHETMYQPLASGISF